MDEAARFIPQVIFKTEKENPEAECLSVWSQIAEEGRNFGIGVVFLTQRSARLNKSVAELADVMVAFRTIGPNSVGAIVEWLGEHKLKKEIAPFVEALRSLPKGDALFVSPGWLEFEGIVHVRLRETFDSSATPKPGERARKVTGKAATPDLAKYAERMRETIERAKENDPGELKRTIAALRKELAQAQKATPAAAEMDPDRLRGVINVHVTNALGTRDREWRKRVDDYVKVLSASVLGALKTSVFTPPGEVPEITREAVATARTVKQPSPPPPRRAVNRRETHAPTNGDASLTGPERRILNAIAWMNSIGVEDPEQTAVAFLAGYTIGGGAWNNPRGALNTKGLVQYVPGDRIRLTDEGRQYAEAPDTPLDEKELQRMVLERLPGPEQKLLRVLIENPDGLSNEELAEAAGYSPGGGAYNNPRGRLRTLGLIEYEGGKVVPRPLLFLQ
jgi:hypothetical protein